MSHKVQGWKPTPAETRSEVYNRSEGLCWYCGVELDVNFWDIDHVIPRSQGGAEGNNLVPSCTFCNRGKRDRSLEEYRAICARKRAGVPRFSTEQREWLAEQGLVFPEPARYLFWFEVEGLDP